MQEEEEISVKIALLVSLVAALKWIRALERPAL